MTEPEWRNPMTDHPEWLVERIAAAMCPTSKHSGTSTICDWECPSIPKAIKVLDALFEICIPVDQEMIQPVRMFHLVEPKPGIWIPLDNPEEE